MRTAVRSRRWSRVLEAVAHAPQRSYRPHYSYADYLAVEEHSGTKHEYVDGAIFAMAGGSRRHNALASRVSAALEAGRAPGCVAFQSDQRVRVLATGRTYYPDASHLCGPIAGDPGDPAGPTITNPSLLVEVLSPSTEEIDRGDKWADYQFIPSLREYVLVSQDRPRVEVYRRREGDGWEYREHTEGVVTLAAGARLDLAWLYAELPE